MKTREATKNFRLNQWTGIIRECRGSGQTVSAWCNDHGINPKSYYYWLRRVRNQGDAYLVFTDNAKC